MFDIGMSEVLVIAVVAIIVVGPKDLPGLLKTAARYMGQLRSMARDFQSQVNDAIRESELDSVRDTMKSVSNINPLNDIKNEVSNYMDSARAFDAPDEEAPMSSSVAENKTPNTTTAIDSGVPPVTPADPAPSAKTASQPKSAKAEGPVPPVTSGMPVKSGKLAARSKPVPAKPVPAKPVAAKPAAKKSAIQSKKTEGGSPAS